VTSLSETREAALLRSAGWPHEMGAGEMKEDVEEVVVAEFVASSTPAFSPEPILAGLSPVRIWQNCGDLSKLRCSGTPPLADARFDFACPCRRS
jgi:hypothetical protein